MIDYVYSRPKKKHTKEIIAFMVLAVVVLAVFGLLYKKIFSFFSANAVLTEKECTEQLAEWCNYCFLTNKYSIEPSAVSENIISKDVLECSNLYFDSGWTEGQNCGSDLRFCYSFLAK